MIFLSSSNVSSFVGRMQGLFVLRNLLIILYRKAENLSGKAIAKRPMGLDHSVDDWGPWVVGIT